MKRRGGLWPAILNRENLRMAASKALRGKRHRPDARDFVARLDANLADIAQQLSSGKLPVGRCWQFVVHDPKERIITAPCFAERVLHHAVMNVCEPVFESWLIDDTYACRRGRGRIAALERARRFAGRFPCVLKLDIRKYFDSIPHDRLLARLARLFKDRTLLDLFGRIVRSFRGQLGHGLPIGSLTSQHLANFYLGSFDRYVKESLRVGGYVRYMDDMALWGLSRGELGGILAACRKFLHEELALDVKPGATIAPVRRGMDFLGCRVFPSHLALNRRSRRRFRRKLADSEAEHAAGRLSEADLQRRATALVAFTRTPGLAAWQFRTSVLAEQESGL